MIAPGAFIREFTVNGAVVILTPKFRSDCKVLAPLFFGSGKKVGGASDLSRGGFRPPPPLADNPGTQEK